MSVPHLPPSYYKELNKLMKWYNLLIACTYIKGDERHFFSYIYPRVPWVDEQYILEELQKTLATTLGISMDDLTILNIQKMKEVE